MNHHVFLAAVVLLAVVGYAVKNRRRKGRKLPPSPPSLPFLGHLHLVGPLLHRSLRELHLRYGSEEGLLLLQLGRRRTLVVSTAAAAADLYRNHDLAFASRPLSAAAHKLSFGSRNITFAPFGDNWRRAKKMAAVHVLSPRRVESFAPVRAAEAAALVTQVRRAAAAANGGAVELRDLLYSYSNAVVTRAATGAAGTTADTLKQLLGNATSLVAGVQADDLLPDMAAKVLRWATGLEKKYDDSMEEWEKFMSPIIAEHVEDGGAGEEDFVDVLLRLKREGTDGFELTDTRVKSIVDLIAAATETTSVTLEWSMVELVANPPVMAKLREEITRVADRKPAITEAEVSGMAYLKAVVKEALRLHPPAPILVPHQSTAAAVVQGYEIPAGTSLFINAWAIGRDTAAWDSPEEFRPERFLNCQVDFRGNDYQLVPFGAGRRICPGINFALPVLEMALVGLLHHFDWELPADVDMSEAPGLTTPLLVPLRLVPKCKTSLA
ncbi:cytochrome P450 71A1-like isoform X2 [Oryza brachyantha]|uniref:cytochrome P450 71A1-like isoform X2 n=1 Tax=Oryza brachyantha TaxID=4533 RepID=UPI001AD97F83|nr:cytochrome P450 71A1-like isoform X2 [Oryza brachyantha]